MESNLSSVRVDRWLSAARIYKSRTEAQKACEGGLVKLGGASVRPSHPLRVGDQLSAQAPRGQVIVVVLALEEKRQSPARARELYEDHSPPPPPREERIAIRGRGMGRPTKSDRRALERLRRVYEVE